MKPQPSSATDQGRNQKHETSGNTVPAEAIPPANRREEGVKRETPEAARKPGASDPKVKTDRPGRDAVDQRGLHR